MGVNVIPGMPGDTFVWPTTGWLTPQEKEIISFWTYHRLNLGVRTDGVKFYTTWGDNRTVGLDYLQRKWDFEQKMRKGY